MYSNRKEKNTHVTITTYIGDAHVRKKPTTMSKQLVDVPSTRFQFCQKVALGILLVAILLSLPSFCQSQSNPSFKYSREANENFDAKNAPPVNHDHHDHHGHDHDHHGHDHHGHDHDHHGHDHDHHAHDHDHHGHDHDHHGHHEHHQTSKPTAPLGKLSIK